MHNRIVAPSLLSADFLHLDKDIQMLNQSKGEWIHCDIMDGQFVPNISFGLPVVKAVRSATTKTIDVHLMIQNPDKYISEFHKAGANVITVHYENVIHLNRVIHKIKEIGCLAGVALNPHTPVTVLEEILRFTDMILLMSVNPGFGGQSFINNVIEKVKKLHNLRLQLNPECLIEVDGGINKQNAGILFDSGANILVTGNSVFSSTNPLNEIEQILNAGVKN